MDLDIGAIAQDDVLLRDRDSTYDTAPAEVDAVAGVAVEGDLQAEVSAKLFEEMSKGPHIRALRAGLLKVGLGLLAGPAEKDPGHDCRDAAASEHAVYLRRHPAQVERSFQRWPTIPAYDRGGGCLGGVVNGALLELQK
ncbi:MAG: hypothetical protein ACREMD_03640 [Gemmatimonadota bacterium]